MTEGGEMHGMGLVQNASSGLAWVNDVITGVVSPADDDHDGRMALLVEGEGITNDERVDLQLIFGDPTKMANAGIHLLGAVLTEDNMAAIAEMVRLLVRSQREANELPHLIDEFKHQLFSPEEQENLPDSFYAPKRGEE